MGEFINLVMSNRYYMILILSLLGVIIFFIIKKMTKFFIYGFIILLAFLAYLFYTGGPDNSTIEPVKDAVKKIK